MMAIVMSSPLNLLLMSVWRLVIVLDPMAPKSYETAARLKYAFVIVWSWAVSCGVLGALGIISDSFVHRGCDRRYIYNKYIFSYFIAIPLISTIAAGLIYLSICNILLFKRTSWRANVRKRELKLTVTLIIV
jgi:hypothetical protein